MSETLRSEFYFVLVLLFLLVVVLVVSAFILCYIAEISKQKCDVKIDNCIANDPLPPYHVAIATDSGTPMELLREGFNIGPPSRTNTDFGTKTDTRLGCPGRKNRKIRITQKRT